MAIESWLVTALPYSASAAEPYHVSLFVTHRLTPDGAEGVVGDFKTVRDWTAHLHHAHVSLRGGGPAGDFDIPVTPLLDALDPTLWPRVFPKKLVVRPWRVPDQTAAPWQSFPAHRMQAHGLLTHALSIFSSPVEAPGVENNLVVDLVFRGLRMHPGRVPLTSVIDGAFDKEISSFLDELSNGGRVGGKRSRIGDPVIAMLADLHAAQRFYQRPEDASAYRDRPIPNAVAVPVKKPTPDFHERAGLLGDLSPLLRKLGLVVDLRVNNLAQIAAAAWIQADIAIEGGAQPHQQPRTACQVVGETFTAPSSSGDYDLGMLRIGDEARYTVMDLDPDATALKLEQYARSLPRIVASANNSDPVNTAPSTLRATGLALARVDRAEQLHDRLDGAAAKDSALLAGTLPPLAQEDISRGVRLEVWDDASREWHSLHQRLLTVDVEAAGEVLSRAPDAGFLQGAALTKSDTAPNGPKYAHEVVAGWDGWSLSAPRPGKVVVHDKGKEEVLDAPPPDPAPANPVESRSEVAPRTLPRLRYGRRYAMRAYAVDLAGNSRPHDVSGAPPREDQPLPPPQPAPPVRATTSAQPDVAHSTEANAGRKETGCEPPHHEDIVALVARRQASKVADALTPPAASGRAALEISALKEMLSAKRGAPSIGPEADKGVAGFDPAGFAATKVEAVDRFVAARIVQKAAAGDASISRAQQVERAFHEAANKASALFERTDLQTSANVAGLALSTALAQQHGLAVGMDASALGKLAQRLADVITTTRPFLRWDALLEPTVVPRFEYTEGESLLRMVIRSGVTQAPADLAITITPPDEYATAVKTARPELGLAWRADSQRHIAPPKTSQFRAELHGAFDEAMGATAPANTVAAALGVALREAGSFLDPTVADIHNPGKRLPQPGVTFHVTRTADDPAVKDPGDLPHGDPLSPGQYVAHDVDRVVLPYLPDPIARGISLMFPDAGKAHRLAGLFALEGTTLDYLGAWPELVPFRLVLESGPQLGAVVEEHVVRVTLPPGEQLRLRLASTVRREKLDLLGLWASLPMVIRDNSFLREVAADGWFWWLTPSAEMRLVHAVPKPLEAPRPTILVPVRPKKGDTAVALVGGIDLHGPSTDRIDIEASWIQWVDDVTKPAPEKVSGKALACGTAVDPDEDLVVLGLADEIFPLPGGGTLRVHGAVHQTGDTLHRKIDYRVRATTRFREYFHPQLVPSPDDLSVIGPVRTLSVPSSARPAKVIVRDVLPLFRWSEETEPGDPFARRRTRKAGLRLYLERPWYSTGDDELLGVVLAAGADALVSDTVSQWGADPVFRQQGPGARSILPLSDLLHLTGIDDRLEAARPVALPALLPLVDKQDSPNAWVLGYRPEFSAERGLWFVDIAFDPGTAFWPFVKLAVARYQPNSLPELYLGPVTLCDYAQLAPERTATLGRTDETHVRIVVTGPVGHPREEPVFFGALTPPDFLGRVARSRRMRARLERFDPSVGTDLGWTTVGQWDLPILGAAGPVFSWAGELPLPQALPPRTPGVDAEWRVAVEEWELLPADYEAGGAGGWQPRIIYADHLLL